VRFLMVESDPGMMGGAVSHEFMAPSPAGEDDVALCSGCGYSANVELALSSAPANEPKDWSREEVHTPEKRTVQEVSSFLKLPSSYFIKSILVTGEQGPVLALVRGDQELHEKKLATIIGGHRPAHKTEVKDTLGVEAGFIGPMGHKIRIIADTALKEGVFVSGANKPHYHLRGVKAGRDFTAEWHDIHTAKMGDSCAMCGSALAIERVIEIGNIFKLGTKYSSALKAYFLDENGQEKPVIMGSYGIGPARIAAAAVEQNNDKDGIVWPRSIAPFAVEILPLNMNDAKTVEIAERLYKDLQRRGVDVLMDDRPERAGVKFKDADLIGIPLQIILGEKTLKEGMLEVKNRRAKESVKTRIEDAVDSVEKSARIP
jgi:prolyl-tRNA synthetase